MILTFFTFVHARHIYLITRSSKLMKTELISLNFMMLTISIIFFLPMFCFLLNCIFSAVITSRMSALNSNNCVFSCARFFFVFLWLRIDYLFDRIFDSVVNFEFCSDKNKSWKWSFRIWMIKIRNRKRFKIWVNHYFAFVWIRWRLKKCQCNDLNKKWIFVKIVIKNYRSRSARVSLSNNFSRAHVACRMSHINFLWCQINWHHSLVVVM